MSRLKSDDKKVKALKEFLDRIKTYNLEELQQEKVAIDEQIEVIIDKINLCQS